MQRRKGAEVIIVGGGLAGLSAAVYLVRAQRETMVVDSGKSMARWEPNVQNYLGFPQGIDGKDLLRRGRQQARRFGCLFRRDFILHAKATPKGFVLRGQTGSYACQRLLIATGAFHIPPDIPGVEPCLGHSMFFCKDCDGQRVQGKTVAIYGWTNEAVEYALGILLYSPRVFLVTDGRKPAWDAAHDHWLAEYKIPVYRESISKVFRAGRNIRGFAFQRGDPVAVEALFTTRGDIHFNQLAKELGAEIDEHNQIVVDANMRTTAPRLYAAGCVTPANCQMIIAAGQGATAAQAINRDLFEHDLAIHSLRRVRRRQLRSHRTKPAPLRRTRSL
ncbi:MAG: NAD(P)/FAD-dependent oxidoreductase, partial [Limisphaerales bacterium]